MYTIQFLFTYGCFVVFSRVCYLCIRSLALLILFYFHTFFGMTLRFVLTSCPTIFFYIACILLCSCIFVCFCYVLLHCLLSKHLLCFLVITFLVNVRIIIIFISLCNLICVNCYSSVLCNCNISKLKLFLRNLAAVCFARSGSISTLITLEFFDAFCLLITMLEGTST